MIAEDICADQYLYWKCHGWTHREMLTAVERPHVVGMKGDDIVEELVMAWQSLDREEAQR